MTNEPRFEIGNPDGECRYPVTLDGKCIGRVFRWHGAWYAAPAGQPNERRIADGAGKELAANYLVELFDSGKITPQEEGEKETPAVLSSSNVPLLHLRLNRTPRNVKAAEKAMTGISEFLWVPLDGYPGADNPWLLRCQLCGWQGPRYWSHLRGRNGNPPSTYRHPGCRPADEVRAAIPAYKRAEESQTVTD
ncbi:hypothetical protein [Streptomyces hydrogenans]|uniref:hypothetical protein n=1 Tax=Streptomyces hydrogenans TaxID=1873719 RepID=UPI0033342C85